MRQATTDSIPVLTDPFEIIAALCDDEEWELASGNRDAFVVTYGRPEDIARLDLATESATVPDSAA